MGSGRVRSGLLWPAGFRWRASAGQRLIRPSICRPINTVVVGSRGAAHDPHTDYRTAAPINFLPPAAVINKTRRESPDGRPAPPDSGRSYLSSPRGQSLRSPLALAGPLPVPVTLGTHTAIKQLTASMAPHFPEKLILICDGVYLRLAPVGGTAGAGLAAANRHQF